MDKYTVNQGNPFRFKSGYNSYRSSGRIVATNKDGNKQTFTSVHFYYFGTEFIVPDSYIKAENLPATLEFYVTRPGKAEEKVDEVKIELPSSNETPSPSPSTGGSFSFYQDVNETVKAMMLGDGLGSMAPYQIIGEELGLLKTTPNPFITDADTYAVTESGLYYLTLGCGVLDFGSNYTPGAKVRGNVDIYHPDKFYDQPDPERFSYHSLYSATGEVRFTQEDMDAISAFEKEGMVAILREITVYIPEGAFINSQVQANLEGMTTVSALDIKRLI